MMHRAHSDAGEPLAAFAARLMGWALLTLLTPSLLLAQKPDSAGAGERTLQPGDVVVVEVWREEDLSGQFLVDEKGSVTLPLLGVRNVVGLSFEALRDELLGAYRAELRNPSVTVTPMRRVYVFGEVHEPGLYTVDPTVSLAGAVALAGGANPQGDIRRMRVVRDGQVVLRGVPGEAALASVDIKSGDQIFVGRRSWFERNSTFLVSAMLSVASIVISLAR